VRDQSDTSLIWEKEMDTYNLPLWKWVGQKKGLSLEQGTSSLSRQLCKQLTMVQVKWSVK